MFEMSWQDVVLTVGNFLFFLALIPSIISANKPSKWTSLITALSLSTFTLTYVSLGLTGGAIMVAATAIGWWTLFIQKVTTK